MSLRNGLILLCLLGSCVAVPEEPLPLSEQAPQVLYAVPSGTDKIMMRPRIALFFSRPVDPSTVNQDSILLSSGTLEEESLASASDLYKEIDKGKLSSAFLKMSVKEGDRVVILSVEEDLAPGQSYTLLVTPRVLSPERVPLNQNPSGSATSFAAVYRTVEVPPQETPQRATMSPPEPDLATPSVASSFSTEDVIPLENSEAVETAPAVSESSSLPSPSEEPITVQEEIGIISASVPETISKVVINELYYDAVGSDTDGVIFIELYGTVGLSLGGYALHFVNGDDGKVYDSITLPQGARLGDDGFYLIADARTGLPTLSQVVGADLIDNFDPQNGPDAVQLVDDSGDLVDALGYGEGIAAMAANGLESFLGHPAMDVVNGHSLERKVLGVDTRDNASDFVEREIPTPGR